MPDSAPPRVVLLTSPSLYGTIIMNTLGRHAGLDLVGIGLTSRLMKNRGPLRGIHTFRKKTGWTYLWQGFLTHNLAWSMLRAKGQPQGVADFGRKVRHVADVNSAESLAWLRELAPDYVASFYFNQWIGQRVREIPSRGCVNMHPSLLPAFRGPDPIFRTLEKGVSQTGLTLHDVADEFDAGAIRHQESRPVPPGSSVLGLYVQQVRDGSQMLADWLAGGLPATSPTENREPVDESYETFPTPAEVRAFLRSGKKLCPLGEWWRVVRGVEG